MARPRRAEHQSAMVQDTVLLVLVERAISLSRPLRTHTVGGVGPGERNPWLPD